MPKPPDPLPAAGIEETERIADWLEQPGIRLIDITGDWMWPIHAVLDHEALVEYALGKGTLTTRPPGAVAAIGMTAMVTAIVFVKAEVARISEVAEEIAALSGVSEVYSVTGAIDLIAMIRVANHDQVAEVVADRLNKVAGVVSTETHIAFRAYSAHDLEAAFSLAASESRAQPSASWSGDHQLRGNANQAERDHPEDADHLNRAAVATRRVRQHEPDQRADDDAADEHQPAEATETDQDAVEDEQDEQPDVGTDVVSHLVLEDRVGREQADHRGCGSIAHARVRAENEEHRGAAQTSCEVEDDETPGAQLGFDGAARDPQHQEVHQQAEDRPRRQRGGEEPPELTEIDGLIAHHQQPIKQPAADEAEDPFHRENRHDDLRRGSAARLQDRAERGTRGSGRWLARTQRRRGTGSRPTPGSCTHRRSVYGIAGRKCRSSGPDGDNTERNPAARSPDRRPGTGSLGDAT